MSWVVEKRWRWRLERTYLAGAELPKDLGDGRRLDAALQELVELDRSGRKSDHGLAILQRISGSFKVHGDEALDNFLQLEHLRLGDTLHFGEFAHRGVSDLAWSAYEEVNRGTGRDEERFTLAR